MRKLLILVLLVSVFFSFSSSSKDKIESANFIPNEAIVKFKRDASYGSDVMNLFRTNSMTIKSIFPSIRTVVVKLPENADTEELINIMNNNPSVEYAEPNYIVYADKTPNDPKLEELWGMKNTGQSSGKAGADIDAEQAWDVSTGSKKVVVAIIDTGVDYRHEDLKENIFENSGEVGKDANGKDKKTNGIDDDENGYVDDWHGWDFVNNDNDPLDDHDHGSHVAGTIGAMGNNKIGVVGVNWKVSIMPLKFLDGGGSGSSEDAIKAIEYATMMKVHIMSNSWGGGGFSKALEDVIVASDKAGILFVAAAGNSGSNNDTSPHYPSSYNVPNIISVAASDRNDEMASFSCFGLNSVHLAAPGKDILSTIKNNEYDVFSGTSMATPHVAGAAALVKAVFPKATHYQIKERLLNGVELVPAFSGKLKTGGRLNVNNAVEVDEISPGAISDLSVVDRGLNFITLTWTAVGDDGLKGKATAYELNYKIVPVRGRVRTETKRLSIAPKESGQREEFKVTGLDFDTLYQFDLRAIDNVANKSAESNIMLANTVPAKVIFTDDLESGLDKWNVMSPWVLSAEDKHSGGYAFSDSEGGIYKNNLDINIEMRDSLKFDNYPVFLSFWHKYDLEVRYDFGYVEIKIPNYEQWIKVAEYNFTSDWKQEIYDITEFITLNGNAEFKIRFRLKSDQTVGKDGWHIDDIAVYTPQQ